MKLKARCERQTIMRWFGIRAIPKFPYSPDNLTREIKNYERAIYILDTIIRMIEKDWKRAYPRDLSHFALDPLADSRLFPRFFRDVSSQKSLATRLVSRKLLPSSPAFLRRWKKPSSSKRTRLPFHSHSRRVRAGGTCATIFRIRVRIAIKNCTRGF